MATNASDRRRANSLKADEEYDLYRLFVHAAEKLKRKLRLKDSDISDSMLELRHQYRSRNWRKPGFSGINFNDESMCCAYLKGYAICHASLAMHATEWLLRKISSSKRGIEKCLFQRGSLKVVCVGGGPGNDLLGFCSAIEGTERTFKELELTVVDLKCGWETFFHGVMSAARSPDIGKAGILLEDEDVQVTFKFVQTDLTCEMVPEIKEADLILMVKVMSNVRGSKRSTMLKNIFSAMKEQAIFFYVDLLASKVEKQANKSSNNMSILFTKQRRSFKLSIGKKKLKDMIPKSTYEICVVQKDSAATCTQEQGESNAENISSEDDKDNEEGSNKKNKHDTNSDDNGEDSNEDNEDNEESEDENLDN